MAFSTQACAAWIAGEARYRRSDILHAAARSVGDTLAAAFAGLATDVYQRSYAVASRYGDGPCSLVGRPERLAAPWAAMVNGAAAHAVELDDNFIPGGTHGSAVLVPALLAQGEVLGVRGQAVLEAFAIGLQLQWRLSAAMNPAHGQRGWHPTSTIAAVGAAGACAKMAGLNAGQTAHALGLSASMMGGSDAQFGFMAKPLHAGLAAKAGVLAADLAAAGVTAGPRALEAMIALMGGDAEAGAAPEDYGAPVALTTLGVTMKIWPTCASTHPAIQAVLLARSADVRHDEIERIEVRIPAILQGNLKYRRPETADEAKFSLEFAVASALVDGGVDLISLEDERRRRRAITLVMDRVQAVVEPDDFRDLRICVVLRHKDGRRFVGSASLDDLPGTLRNPLDQAALVQKLVGCAAGRLTEAQAASGLSAVLRLAEDTPLEDVLRLYRLDV